jgi:hypothetical protein
MSDYKLVYQELYKQDYNRCVPIDPSFECAICLNRGVFTRKPKRYVKQLSCGHKFHVTCINRWMFDHMTCPVCRHRNYYWCAVLPERRAFFAHLVNTFHVNLDVL